MSWTPPVTLEERAKALLIPPSLALRWDLWRERRGGEREIRLVPQLADPARVSLDIGANRGVWTAALLPHSKAVIAFEPNPKLFAELSRRLGTSAAAHQIALSDEAGTAELRVPRRRKGYSNQGATLAHASLNGTAYGAVQVRAARLDDLDLGDVGFIKIDVEGHELAVLRGATALLARCRPTLLIEMEEKHGRRPIAAMLADVRAHGYDAFALLGGALRPVESIDLARHHSAAASRADYIFNWVFRPRELDLPRPPG